MAGDSACDPGCAHETAQLAEQLIRVSHCQGRLPALFECAAAGC